MKNRIAQLTARYQQYSPREKTGLKLCAAALCCAAIYYAGVVPLDNMIKSSQTTLFRQQETLSWMRVEIDKNHLQIQQVKTSNPRSVVEVSAHKLNVTLKDVQQDGKSLSFTISRINVNELKNWLRELNMSTGIRLEKLRLTPVDRLNDVSAVIQLTWRQGA